MVCARDSPGKNPRVVCHSHLQRIFLTQGSLTRDQTCALSVGTEESQPLDRYCKNVYLFKWFSHWGLFWNCRQNSHLFQFFELSTRVCGFLAPWFHVDVCTCMLSHHSRLILCDPMDCSPPGPSVRGILQARALEGVAISFFRGSSQPRDGRQVLYHSATWEAQGLSPEESLSFLSSLLNKHLLRNWLFSLTRPMKAASFREITAAHPWSKAPLALLPRAI